MCRMRITEVARHARVSTATVSRTINRTGTVRPDTAEKVWRVVRKLGYHPDTNARALVSGRSHQLGLIISDIANPFFPELVKSFEEIALRNGFEVLVANTGYDTERMSQSVRRMLERKVDGVAVITSEMEKELIAQMERRRLPMVFLDTGRVRDRISNIKVDYSSGIREAVEHLFRLGHERIAFISGPLDLRSALTRRSSFMQWLKRYNLLRNEKMIETGNHKIDGGELAMQRLLALPQRPTAVLASNDLTAIGALRAIYSAKLRVPEDVSVVGFDDIQSAAFQNPGLTTVRQPLREMGVIAAETLLRRINAPAKTPYPKAITVEPELIVRESTAKVKP